MVPDSCSLAASLTDPGHFQNSCRLFAGRGATPPKKKEEDARIVRTSVRVRAGRAQCHLRRVPRKHGIKLLFVFVERTQTYI